MDKLYFFSRSRNLAPGKGVHEVVKDPRKYCDLSEVKNWRRILSLTHEHIFRYGNYTYLTIMHAYYSIKISIFDWSCASKLTLESCDPLSVAKIATIKKYARDATSKYDANLVDLNIDRSILFYEIINAKYSACPYGCHVLMLTNNAELWYITTCRTKVRLVVLEELRNRLKSRG